LNDLMAYVILRGRLLRLGSDQRQKTLKKYYFNHIITQI
jgi:hypothetical protein